MGPGGASAWGLVVVSPVAGNPNAPALINSRGISFAVTTNIASTNPPSNDAIQLTFDRDVTTCTPVIGPYLKNPGTLYVQSIGTPSGSNITVVNAPTTGATNANVRSFTIAVFC